MTPKLRFFLICFAIAYPLDQLTKRWIVEAFYYGESLVVIPGFFDLTHVRNPGGAFSMLAGASADWRLPFFLTAGAVAVALLLVFYRRLPARARLSAAALGMILGGALGNLTDRVVYGEVIDWLDVHLGAYTWPTFNVADSCVVVGVAVLILEVFLYGEELEERDAAEPQADAVVADSEQPSA
jgi:signal peptidase II